MKKLGDSLKSFISTMIIILLIFGAGFGTAWYIKTSKPEGEIVESDDKSIDLEMPGEVEREAITKEDVQIKLKELEEFSTYEGDYEVTLKKEETRYMLDDIKIPGTTNSIEITCDGVVKAGYDLNDIEVRIDDNTIYISLPDSPNINDNYIKWDTVECSEKNNILNPIEFSQYKTLVDEIEKKGLEKAESEGIYEKAQEHIKTIIKGFYDQYFFTHLSFSTPFRYFDSSGFPRHPQQNFKTRSYLPRDKDPRPAPEARGFLRGNAGFHTGPVLIAKLFLQKYPRA